jgi:hypothetical protein
MIEKGIFELCGLIFVVFSSCFRETENFTAKSTGFDRWLWKEMAVEGGRLSIFEEHIGFLINDGGIVYIRISPVHFVTTEH